MPKVYHALFENIASSERLFRAFEEFRKGKGSRPDVQEFESRLEERIFALHWDLMAGRYRHGPYSAFMICDPKQRPIHKATVRDRVLHHAVFAALNPVFEPTFIAHSFSCRRGKGTHRGVDALETMLRKVSRNGALSCFALKCDIHRFFASVDHGVLLGVLARTIKDDRVLRLLDGIIGSFGPSGRNVHVRKGIPIGNLTSQLFANIIMNEFDQFVKHRLRVKHYIRYTDDFVMVTKDEKYLRDLLPCLRRFLHERLHFDLHPHKVTIRKYRQGIDFLGYVLLPHHRVLRAKTKRRIFRKMQDRLEECLRDASQKEPALHALQSYLGVLAHANAHQVGQDLMNQCGLLLSGT